MSWPSFSSCLKFEAGAVCDEIALPRCIFPLGLDELVERFVRWCSTNPRVQFVPPGLLSSPPSCSV